MTEKTNDFKPFCLVEYNRGTHRAFFVVVELKQFEDTSEGYYSFYDLSKGSLMSIGETSVASMFNNGSLKVIA